MDCREFRKKHVDFVDDTLCAVEMADMRRHRDRCPSCARLDVSVRRSLLLVRNLPCIEASPDFMERLNERLRILPAEAAAPRGNAIGFGTFAAVAAGLLVVSLFGYEMSSRAVDREPLRLPPVVATVPELPPSSVASPAFVASAPTGMGFWPAVLGAGAAQLHMASLELQDSR